MGNLTGYQISALFTSQPIAQRWTVRVPLDAQHSAYFDTTLDSGVFNGGLVAPSGTPLRRVTNAGSRRHKVWNPSPQFADAPDAVTYSFEVSNADRYFCVGLAGSAWNPLGLYSSRPQECIIVHELFIWSPLQLAWQEVPHMKFTGEIKSVEYTGTLSMTGTTGGVRANAPLIATINCEQQTAQTALRSRFTEADGDYAETHTGAREML